MLEAGVAQLNQKLPCPQKLLCGGEGRVLSVTSEVRLQHCESIAKEVLISNTGAAP